MPKQLSQSGRPWREKDVLPDADQPITNAEFDHAMASLGPFEEQPTLAVAVSGGPDSLALAILAKTWCDRREGAVLAIIVDHGLRDASAAEARQAKAWLAPLGIRSIVIRLRGLPRHSRIQETGRIRRYEALARACSRLAILHLLVGHHADDQVETVAMRLDHGSGVIGLAGMPMARELAQTRLLRPILTVPKSRLRALLIKEKQAWIDDPSNEDVDFERARIRRCVRPTLEFERNPTGERALLELEAANFMPQCVAISPFGYAEISLPQLSGLSIRHLQSVLTPVFRVIGGGVYPVARATMERCIARLFSLRVHTGTTLGGCLLRRLSQSKIVVVREWKRIPNERYNPKTGPWDRRFSFGPDIQGRLLMPLGQLGWAWLSSQDRSRIRTLAIPKEAALSWPAIVLSSKDVVLTRIPPIDLDASVHAPVARFRPASGMVGVPFGRKIIV